MIDTSSTTHRKLPKVSILVIEDNADQWFLIQWALRERFPEAEAVWLSDAAQVTTYLKACEQNLPRLILLDLYLPHRHHGWSLLESIKTHHVYREIPVVILSHSTDTEDIRESYALRGNSYMVKPIGDENWLDCISSFRQYWWDSVTLPNYY